MFEQSRADLSRVQNVMVDGGYTGKPFAAEVQNLLGASVEVVKRNELHTFVVLPKRWVVERSFALAGEVAADYGRTARESSIPACKWWFSRLRGANPEEIVNRLLVLQRRL